MKKNNYECMRLFIPSVISTTDSLQNRCFNSINHYFYYSGVTTSSQ